MLLKDHYSQNTKIITDTSNILNWYFCPPLEHININSISYHTLRLIERHFHKAKHNTTQKTTTMRNMDPTKTRGGERRGSRGVSNSCFINYSYEGIMTEYGWKWHENGIKINKRNLTTNNTHSHKNRRERSLRS
jgi:hypothetical protein